MGHHHSVARPGYHDGFEVIARYGNRWPGYPPISHTFAQLKIGRSVIVCRDGFTFSVIAGYGAHCSPRRDDETSPCGHLAATPYNALEFGYPSARPEPWEDWRHYAVFPEWDFIYAHVPVSMIRELMQSHGGFRRMGRTGIDYALELP
jgi:hypothetical protein